MLLGLHAGCIMHTNIVTDIRIAKEAGYDCIELVIEKLERYLNVGYQVEELIPQFGRLRPTMFNCILPIEEQDPVKYKALLARVERLAVAADKLKCPVLQCVAFDALKGRPWNEIRDRIAKNLRDLADIAAHYNLKMGLEPLSFTSFHTLKQAYEVLEVADRKNIGLVIDTFHIWAGGTPWEDVAAMDPNLIVCAHIADTGPKHGEIWSDDDREVLPGDGIIPMREGLQAIRACGFDGIWSVEMLSHPHWEWEPELLARELKRRSDKFLADVLLAEKAGK